MPIHYYLYINNAHLDLDETFECKHKKDVKNGTPAGVTSRAVSF